MKKFSVNTAIDVTMTSLCSLLPLPGKLILLNFILIYIYAVLYCYIYILLCIYCSLYRVFVRTCSHMRVCRKSYYLLRASDITAMRRLHYR